MRSIANSGIDTPNASLERCASFLGPSHTCAVSGLARRLSGRRLHAYTRHIDITIYQSLSQLSPAEMPLNKATRSANSSFIVERILPANFAPYNRCSGTAFYTVAISILLPYFPYTPSHILAAAVYKFINIKYLLLELPYSDLEGIERMASTSVLSQSSATHRMTTSTLVTSRNHHL